MSGNDDLLKFGVLGLAGLVAAGAALGVRPDQTPGVMADKVEHGVTSAWSAVQDQAGQFRPSYVPHERRAAVKAVTDDLRVAPDGPEDGYSRTQFGQRWRDTDRNGCDQRNDVLRRDMTSVKRDGRCVVVSGVLDDPYTGASIIFRKGDDSVDVDHVYALSAAWKHGAAQWTAAKREKFANDPRNLIAVGSKVNRSKGDQGPADWQPPGGDEERCRYARRYIVIADLYRLTVTPADKTRLAGMLGHCPKEDQ